MQPIRCQFCGFVYLAGNPACQNCGSFNNPDGAFNTSNTYQSHQAHNYPPTVSAPIRESQQCYVCGNWIQGSTSRCVRCGSVKQIKNKPNTKRILTIIGVVAGIALIYFAISVVKLFIPGKTFRDTSVNPRGGEIYNDYIEATTPDSGSTLKSFRLRGVATLPNKTRLYIGFAGKVPDKVLSIASYSQLTTSKATAFEPNFTATEKEARDSSRLGMFPCSSRIAEACPLAYREVSKLHGFNGNQGWTYTVTRNEEDGGAVELTLGTLPGDVLKSIQTIARASFAQSLSGYYNLQLLGINHNTYFVAASDYKLKDDWLYFNKSSSFLTRIITKRMPEGGKYAQEERHILMLIEDRKPVADPSASIFTVGQYMVPGKFVVVELEYPYKSPPELMKSSELYKPLVIEITDVEINPEIDDSAFEQPSHLLPK